jgi:spermidine/putrescine transport system substrate-binding protein
MNKTLLVASLLFTSLSALAEDVLHVYNWNNYLAEDTIKRFEADCKCKLVQDFYSDNEELLAKLAAGAKGYDILVPTQNAVDSLIKQKALKALDKSQLTNINNVNPDYLNKDFDPSNQYSIPYSFTTTLLGYNSKEMQRLGIPVDSWAVIFDPKILEKIKGKVTVLDSQRELMAASLKYLGYSVNDTDMKHWKEAAEVIIKAKPYWAAFNGSSYIKELTVGNIWVAHGYSSDMYQANLDAKQAKRDFSIEFNLPKEGAVLALDNMVIHKDAPRPDLAHKFINFILIGKNAADLSNMIGTGSPNAAAQEFIKPEIKALKAVFPDAETVKHLETLKDQTSKERRELTKLWTKIKAK